MPTTPTQSNPFAVAAADSGALVQVAQSKEAQQIQAQLVIAKKFPRDPHVAFQAIMEACKRVGLAEEATYLYSRGGTQITGASIRLLEVVAQNWGNFRSGVIELDQADGESRMEAFAWDFQSNVYDSKTFTVRHERYSKAGGVENITDGRDVYELVANFAARRKRACMEAVIPRDIVEAAMEQCDRTLKSGHTEPLADRVRKMVSLFAEQGVTVDMLERRLQHKLSAVIEQEMVTLRKIYTALKDGMGKREDFFDVSNLPKPAKFEPAKPPTTPPPPPSEEQEKAEAAAGLAPAPKKKIVSATLAPAAPAPEPPPPAEPAEPPEPTPPPPPVAAPQPPPAQAPAPQPAQFTPPAQSLPPIAYPPSIGQPPSGELFGQQQQPPLVKAAYDMLPVHKVTEQEVLNVLKARGICANTVENFGQLPEIILTDLVANQQIIASQCRIDRKGTGRKK